MTNSGGNYIDYLNFMISEQYTLYWKFEVERGNTPADHYKADCYISVINVLEECRDFFLNNVKTETNSDGLINFLDFLYDKSVSYSLDSLEFFALNLIILSVSNLLQS